MDASRTRQSFEMPLSENALKLFYVLEQAGFEAWAVGGCVRDALLGTPCADIDIATNAPWEISAELAKTAGFAAHETGIAHGTITVVINNEPIEVTTFRSESAYSDHRHPDKVTFVKTIEEDLARRDFSINAIAYHPTRGIVDPFDGMQDLENKTIRAVGDPQKRFLEDALRILRSIRFAAQLGFDIEDETERAAFELAPTLNFVASERKTAEVEKIICGSNTHHIIMRYVDILGIVIPELLPMKHFDQRTRFHVYDILEHTAYVTDYSPRTPLARWAGLLHDVGKPDTFFIDSEGVGHMYGHPDVGANILRRSIAPRMRFPRKLTHDLELLIRHHDSRPANTPKSIRKLFAKLEYREDLFFAICDLMRADDMAHAEFCHERITLTNEIENTFRAMRAADVCFSVKDLDISGSDLIALGIEEGPAVGETLKKLFHAVANNETENDRDSLLSFTRDSLLPH